MTTADDDELRRDVARLAGLRVLVVGDLVLDEYVTGRPMRISREAPVPVLERVDHEDRAGSAASPAANIIALGSQATVVGVVGCDAEGARLEAALRRLGLDDLERGLLRRAEIPTAVKTRVMAQGYTGGLHGRQQVLRLDRTSVVSDEVCARVADRVAQLAPSVDALLVSDYRGGVIGTPSLAALRATGRPITVDSQGDVRRFAGVDLLKINQAEAQAAIGHEAQAAMGRGTQAEAQAAIGQAALTEGGLALQRELGVRQLVITLGAEGMLVFAEGSVSHVPAVGVSEVFDVTGAGDTVIAVLTLGLIGGLEPLRAARLASAAASVVVRRLGVATASPDEILAALTGAK